MAKRKIRDEQDARWCLAQAESAGVTSVEWARKHGVDGRSLLAWTRKLDGGYKHPGARQVEPEEKASGMVELVPAASRSTSRYLIRCGPLSVEVDEHFDEAVLTRLLRAMAAC